MKLFVFEIGDKLLPNATFPKQPSAIGPFVSSLARNAIIIAGIITIVMIIYGGLTMISTAGSNNPQNAARARQIITYGVVGFILIFAAYWIVQAVEIITGTTIF